MPGEEGAPTGGGDQMGAPSFPDPGSGTGVGGDEEEEVGEARDAKPLCEPCDPTMKQLSSHRLSCHLPFRS